MRRQWINALVVTVLTVLSPALPASAQPTGQTGPDAKTGQTPPVTSPNERKAERVQGPGTKAPAEPRKTPVDRPVLDDDEIEKLEPGKRDAAIYRKLANEEEKYRKRRAKLDRLRELAIEKDQQQRLVAIDKLEAKVEQAYQKTTAKWHARLGDVKYKRMKDRLGKGNSKGKGRADKADGKPDDRDAGRERSDEREPGTSNERKPGKGEPGARGGPSNKGGPGAGSQSKDAGKNDKGKGAKPKGKGGGGR